MFGTVTAIGWGNRSGPRRFSLARSINETATISPHVLSRYLNFIRMKVISRHMCLEIFQRYGLIHYSQSCASSITKNGAVSWVRNILF